jgi:hypothetical protein
MIAGAKPVNAEGQIEEPIDYGLITASEMLCRDYPIEYLVPGVFAKGQHCLLGAPLKGCKSLVAIDLAVALSTAGRFLDHFPVPRPVRSIVISLESGWPVLQENVRRISRAAGATAEDLGNLFVAIRGPKFGRPDHMQAIADSVKQTQAEAVIIDCAYRCIPGDVASNVLSMGELLDSVGNVFEECNSTLLLVHHSPKHIPPGDPLQLDNLAFAGFAEFAAQWLLLNRRTAYQPGSGHHDLWLTIGARAGHGGLYGVQVDEGEFHQGHDREWRVTVTPSKEVFQERQDTKEKEREAKRLEKLEADKQRIVLTMAKYPAGASKSFIRDASGINSNRVSLAMASLLDDGSIEQCGIVTGNRKQPQEGYRLVIG